MSWWQAEAVNSCADLEFVNQRSDTIHATVNRSINVTFKVVWKNCLSVAGNILIKISTNCDAYPTEECKLTLNVNHCNVSTSSYACYCVTSAGPVIFSKTFTHVTNVTYTWSLESGVKDRSIVFIVTNYSNYDTSEDGAVNTTHHQGHQTALIGGVVAGSAIFVFGGIIAGIIACCRQTMKSQTARPSKQTERRPQGYESSSQKRLDSLGPQSEVYEELFELPE
ncbi:uncharacterized protein LOC112568233 [Pomacea canaliculata]|uniref:uncharacterized protein LOC112568233 n=1 Tax=Pomacea canaliculata TaxID=400727 RepID=UPI000D73C1A3|nr:uncharacterized protein LOC112568233 [Pomacea canaliculata]XP_025101217.1 uncharacterized protein LOC112568233 [Pomacea canaliculata]